MKYSHIFGFLVLAILPSSSFAKQSRQLRKDDAAVDSAPDTTYCHCKTRTGLGANPDHWLDGTNDLVIYSYLGDPTSQGDHWVWTVVDCGTFRECMLPWIR